MPPLRLFILPGREKIAHHKKGEKDISNTSRKGRALLLPWGRNLHLGDFLSARRRRERGLLEPLPRGDSFLVPYRGVVASFRRERHVTVSFKEESVRRRKPWTCFYLGEGCPSRKKSLRGSFLGGKSLYSLSFMRDHEKGNLLGTSSGMRSGGGGCQVFGGAQGSRGDGLSLVRVRGEVPRKCRL